MSVLAITSKLAWLDVLYFLSAVKVGVSLSKYVPQLILNQSRQSTIGWSIYQVLLDFTGGTLSITQMVLDAYIVMDFTGLWGNWPKLALGGVSMVFDVAFMVQHYVLYPQHRRRGLKQAGWRNVSQEEELATS